MHVFMYVMYARLPQRQQPVRGKTGLFARRFRYSQICALLSALRARHRRARGDNRFAEENLPFKFSH